MVGRARFERTTTQPPAEYHTSLDNRPTYEALVRRVNCKTRVQTTRRLLNI